MLTSTLLSGLALALTASATPLVPRGGCSSYVILNTRGTFEMQGESFTTRTMNTRIQSSVSGGTLYSVVYPAGADQNSGAATTDIINQINNGLASNPNQCFVLEGYSQGAAATVNAMKQLSGAAFNAVKAVVLFGNPYHKAGLSCNVDDKGSDSNKNVDGISAYQGVSIPSNWVSKTRDVCYQNDGICNTEGSRMSLGLNVDHLQYGSSDTVQSQSSDFIIQRLRA